MKNAALNATLFVHQHIFGNAGEFVDQYLHASFANEWRQIDLEFPENKYLSSADLLALTADGCRLRACSTMYPVSIDDESRISSFVLLADPIVRAKQVFLRVAGDSTQPNSELAREQGFRGYVEWALGGGHGGVVICNYQTLHLSNVFTRELDIVQAVAGNQEFAEAMNNLGKVGFVGVADRPVCSIKKLQITRRLCFPELQMDSLLRYFSGRNRPSIQAQRETIKNELGEALFERLVEANRLDTQLYQRAKKIFSSSDDALCLGHATSDQECGCLNAPLTSSHLAERPLFFLHIPKTAGTAFSLHLKNQFSCEAICPAGYWPELLDMPSGARRKYKLIAGHFSDLTKAFFDDEPECVTVLRNPIDRVLSLIFYQKHLAESTPQNFSNASVTELALAARSKYNHDIESVLSTDDFKVLQSISNYQTRVLSGSQVEPAYVLDNRHLDAAKKNLLRYKIVGLTERMQESLDMLSFFMGWAPIDDLVINETPKIEERRKAPTWVIDKIRELNLLDLQLYEYGKEIFEKQQALMPKYLFARQKYLDITNTTHNKGMNDYYAFSYANHGPVCQDRFNSKLGFGPVGASWWEWEERPNGGGCRWTGPGPDSFLDLPVLKQHDLLIVFRIAGYASEPILSSTIVSADGERLDTQLVTGASGEIFIQAVAGLSLLNQKLPFLRVGIHLMATMSAKDINPAARNNRRLGLAIHALEVRPVGEGVAV